MRDVFVVSDNIISPIGFTTGENLANLEKNISAIKKHTRPQMSDEAFYASLFDPDQITSDPQYTKFEQLLINSVKEALKDTEIDPADSKTILIVSSTKGNISLLEKGIPDSITEDRIALYSSAKLIAAHFNFLNKPVVVSNACISGILAILTGVRLIQSGQYNHAVIVGADIISKFILSGFQSFQAISSEPCKPFDAERNGINLGEGAAAIVLSSNEKYSTGIKIAGGSVSNDANHISGPSRTGDELCMAIKKTLKAAAISEKEIDLISAHGTATIYNDEMEAKAIRLAGMEEVPVNSLKGFYGHTLGAAGIIESVIAVHSLKDGYLFPTFGFSNRGVSVPLALSNKLQKKTLRNVLKTASGFGGCNAAMLICKQ